PRRRSGPSAASCPTWARTRGAPSGRRPCDSSRTKPNGLRGSPVHNLATASCAFGLGKRRDCAFQPMLMRREPLSGGLFAEEFIELNPPARRDSVTAPAPLYAESAPVDDRLI